MRERAHGRVYTGTAQELICVVYGHVNVTVKCGSGLTSRELIRPSTGKRLLGVGTRSSEVVTTRHPVRFMCAMPSRIRCSPRYVTVFFRSFVIGSIEAPLSLALMRWLCGSVSELYGHRR